MTTNVRETLTRDRVIDAAVAYADENGLEKLSMRKLGAELGVEAMSLYNHVDNKDDMFGGMVDRVFASIALPDLGGDWRSEIRRVGAAALDAFAAHPWVVPLLMMRANFDPAGLRFMDRVIAVLAAAGFSDEDAHHAWQMLASHTMGYAFQRTTNPAVEHGDIPAALDPTLLAREYPNVARIAPFLATCDFESEFAFGLEIIIDGLESRLGQP